MITYYPRLRSLWASARGGSTPPFRTINKTNNDGGETDISDPNTETECGTLKTAVEPMDTGDCWGVGVQNQGEAPKEENQPVGKEVDDADLCSF